MFRKELILDKSSYVELTSRKMANGEALLLALRGPKSDGQISLASVALSKEEVEVLKTQLQQWLESLVSN